jgi:hypothetical protein
MNLDQRPEWSTLRDKIIEMICRDNPDFSRDNFQFECNEDIAIVFHNNEQIGQINFLASRSYENSIGQDINLN